MQKLLLSYAGVLFAQSVQLAVCHSKHAIEQRLCRYLMVVGGCLRSTAWILKQEDIALMLSNERNRQP
jgi:hypothetical protein